MQLFRSGSAGSNPINRSRQTNEGNSGRRPAPVEQLLNFGSAVVPEPRKWEPGSDERITRPTGPRIVSAARKPPAPPLRPRRNASEFRETLPDDAVMSPCAHRSQQYLR